MGKWRCVLLMVISILVFMPPNGQAAGFTKEAIDFEARSLLNQMEITRDVNFKLKNRLSAALSNDAALNEAMKASGVHAVFTYACGEGGIVFKYMGGDGLISFVNGRKAAPFTLKGWSAGAMIGGSAQWGIGLVIGEADENDFGGAYRGGLRGATAWEAATKNMLFLRSAKEKKYHELYIISTSRGLSAGVGGTIMQLTPDW
ncbi:MAG: hypothetical protein JW943_11795 [Deltaproteobacteria bacterium]|nr:hypothetical protein [Deltaproteobacteria bacterium]